MKKYYIHDGRQQIGPFDLVELKTHNIHANTMIWSAGMEKWEKAKTFPEFVDLLATSPPPFEKKNFGSKALNKAKDALNKVFVQDIEKIIPNKTGKRSFKIAIFNFAFIGIVFAAIYLWPKSQKERLNPTDFIRVEKPEYYYYHSYYEDKKGSISGYVATTDEKTSNNDIKFYVQYYAKDDKTLCDDEDLGHTSAPLLPSERKCLSLIIPQTQLPKECKKVNRKVIDAYALTVQ